MVTVAAFKDEADARGCLYGMHSRYSAIASYRSFEPSPHLGRYMWEVIAQHPSTEVRAYIRGYIDASGGEGVVFE